MIIQDYLDICDPVLTFDRFMGEIELEKYLKNIPQHYTGRLRYDPVSMWKTVLFGFMANGYISLRELEDQCKVNLRFMYLTTITSSVNSTEMEKYMKISMFKKETTDKKYREDPFRAVNFLNDSECYF